MIFDLEKWLWMSKFCGSNNFDWKCSIQISLQFEKSFSNSVDMVKNLHRRPSSPLSTATRTYWSSFWSSFSSWKPSQSSLNYSATVNMPDSAWHKYETRNSFLVLLQIPKCFGPVQIFCARPKIELNLVPLHKQFCAGTKIEFTKHKSSFGLLQKVWDGDNI